MKVWLLSAENCGIRDIDNIFSTKEKAIKYFNTECERIGWDIIIWSDQGNYIEIVVQVEDSDEQFSLFIQKYEVK